MSYHPNRATYDDAPNIRGERSLPKVNDKRFSDVIDYNQPRPQSGYQNKYNASDDEDTGVDDRNYVQRQSGPDRKSQYDQGARPNGTYNPQQQSNSGADRKSQYDQGARSNGTYNPQQQSNGYGNQGSTGYSNAGAYDGGSINTQEGQAVQLIRADPRSGKFSLNEQLAAELTANYEGNISFVCVAGKYRTGKSYLLNKLLNLKGEGFVVDSATDACTQGIWMWSKPIYSEKDNLHIFFLDTEGSNSVEKSQTHDAKIFALALLMSSYFIYNSVGNIDENSINDLSLTTQLSRNIQVSTEENSQHTLSYYTPKFLWALRDFTLELQDANGKPISANQYLENALTDQSTFSKSTEANKKVRQALLNYFKDRECMTFVRPANDERDLKRLNTLANNQIRPEFIKQLNSLRDKIMNKSTAKQLKGVNLNMRMYTAMLQKYVEAINTGSVPNISSAWDHLVENECRESYEQSVELYDIALKQFFFNEDRAKSIEELYNVLKNIRDSALEKYNKMTASIERNDVANEFKNELKDYIDKKEQQVVGINEELNQTNNEELLHALAQVIRNNITSGAYGPQNIQDYHDDMGQFLDTYDSQSQGFSKTQSLIKFMNNFQPEVISSLMLSLNKSYQTNQKNYEQEKARYTENEKNLKMNLDILKEKEKSAADQVSRLKGEKAELSNKTTKLNDQLQRVRDEEEEKLAQEKAKAKLDMNKLKEKEKEVAELSRQNKELLAQIQQRKNACCNMF